MLFGPRQHLAVFGGKGESWLARDPTQGAGRDAENGGQLSHANCRDFLRTGCGDERLRIRRSELVPPAATLSARLLGGLQKLSIAFDPVAVLR